MDVWKLLACNFISPFQGFFLTLTIYAGLPAFVNTRNRRLTPAGEAHSLTLRYYLAALQALVVCQLRDDFLVYRTLGRNNYMHEAREETIACANVNVWIPWSIAIDGHATKRLASKRVTSITLN